MSLLLFLIACHGVSETGAKGMAGRLVDASGSPVSGVVVSTVEAESRTDAEGLFAVSWKNPDHYVFFSWQGLFFQRTMQPDDSGRTEITLPKTRSVSLSCLPSAEAVTLTWTLSPALEARRVVKCKDREVLDLGQIPVKTPELKGAPPGLTLKDDGEKMALVARTAP